MVRRKFRVDMLLAVRLTGAFTSVTAFDREDFLARPCKWRKEECDGA